MIRLVRMLVAVVRHMLVPLGASAVMTGAMLLRVRKVLTMLHMAACACGRSRVYLSGHGARTAVY